MDKVTHFELGAMDIERAKQFYEDIFGWGIKKVPFDMPYWIIHTAEIDKDNDNMPKELGVINGGLMEKMPGDPGSVVVVQVDSIDDRLNRTEEKGGKIVMSKNQVGEMGYYARIQDPEGNVIGIWEDIKK